MSIIEDFLNKKGRKAVSDVDRRKMIAIYGTKPIKKEHTYKQRYWKKRSDGVKQRYWVKVTRKQKYHASARFEVIGRGKELQKAVGKVLKEPLVPKERFVKVEAEELLEHPEEYAEPDEEWTRRPRIESP